MKFRNVIYYSLYLIFGKHLPISYHIGGKLAMKVRYLLLNKYVAQCGKNVNFEKNCQINSTLKIGDNSSIGVNAIVGDYVTIGKFVMMGPNCIIYTRNHKHEISNIPFVEQGYEEFKPVFIDDNVWIGEGVKIMPGTRINKNTVVAAGAIVTKEFPPNCIIGGNPARVLKELK